MELRVKDKWNFTFAGTSLIFLVVLNLKHNYLEFLTLWDGLLYLLKPYCKLKRSNVCLKFCSFFVGLCVLWKLHTKALWHIFGFLTTLLTVWILAKQIYTFR